MQPDESKRLEEDRIRFAHMLASAQRTLRIASGMTEETLGLDEIKLLAIVKSIEVIGEASTKVSDETCAQYPTIEWRGIRKMRNRMVHGYDTVDVAIVWRTITNHVPPLIADLEKALASWPEA